MSKIRIKLFTLLIALFAFASVQFAQSTEEINPVIDQGIISASTGITYWNAEAVNSKIFCNDDTFPYCENMDATCTREVAKWTAELKHQLQLAKQVAETNATYTSISKYLKFAYKTIAVLKSIDEAYHIPGLAAVINGLETAIKFFEKLIAIFN